MPIHSWHHWFIQICHHQTHQPITRHARRLGLTTQPLRTHDAQRGTAALRAQQRCALLDRIRRYIAENPFYWHLDSENPSRAKPGHHHSGLLLARLPRPRYRPTIRPVSRIQCGARRRLAEIRRNPTRAVPLHEIRRLCVLDASKEGVIIVPDRVLAPPRYEILILGSWSHWAMVLSAHRYL